LEVRHTPASGTTLLALPVSSGYNDQPTRGEEDVEASMWVLLYYFPVYLCGLFGYQLQVKVF